MQIAPGTRLGPYEIVAPIGAGGMGEVFRARDTRLDRSVAVKILPAHLSSSSHFRERFDREARAISAISHPHICALYDVGQHDGVGYLVMEYLDGESLADRLSKGPLPIEQVAKYGAQIAEALERAHKAGIVHRDLKPGNVMITRSGAKLLDFGLAKTQASAFGVQGSAVTQHKPLTEEGTLLGTFQYMAPEQIEGGEADHRTDIFALGALLYEMATGRRAFEGKSKASLIASILDREPPPISAIQPVTPASFERIVRTCLAKDPDQRWQSAHDVAMELTWVAASQVDVAHPTPRRAAVRERAAWVLAALALLTAAATLFWSLRVPPAPATYSHVVAPSDTTMLVDGQASGSLTISPDGRMITFSAETRGKRMLWLRDLSSGSVRPLPFTENGVFPFWSADGRQLAFFADGKLKKIDIRGGPAITLANAEEGRSGSWNRDGVIIFEPHWRLPIHRISANGGASVPITTIDEAAQETTHRWATFLPDGRHFLYLAGSHLAESDSDRNSIYIASLDSPERKLLLHARSNAVYSAGHLLFVRDRFLLAQPFDPDRRTLSGEPRPIAENVHYTHGYLRASFDASPDGTLVYHPATPEAVSALHWVDRTSGTVGPAIGVGNGEVHRVTLSPDSRRAILSEGSPSDLWLTDLERSARTRLTTHRLNEENPVWAPDGRTVVFGSDRNIDFDLYMMTLDGSGDEQLVARWPGTDDMPTDWSSDGRYIVFRRGHRGGSSDIWILPLFGDRKPFPYRQTAAEESHGVVSPDGKWMAFTSDHSGRRELYVSPFPVPGPAVQVSPDGATRAKWRGDGRELIFPAGAELMAARIDTSPSLTVGKPAIIQTVGKKQDWWARMLNGDSATDGSRFLVALRQGAPPQVPVTLVQNWSGRAR